MESKPEDNVLFDRVFAIGRVNDGDPAIYHDVTLSQAEEVEREYAKRAMPGGSSTYLTSFEDWFLEHCMNREVRPVESLEQFSVSESRSIREIAIKALKDRYGILQSDKLNAEMVSLTRKMVEVNQSVANSTKLTFWSTLAAAVIALIALCVSCSTNK